MTDSGEKINKWKKTNQEVPVSATIESDLSQSQDNTEPVYSSAQM